MKKRVRKTQRLTVWIKGMFGAGHYEQITVKHDGNRPVRTLVADRVVNYTKQNGGDWLTPRQARRLRLKGGATSTPVRGRVASGGSRTHKPDALDAYEASLSR